MGTMTVILPDLQLPLQHQKAVSSVLGWIADQSGHIREVHQIGDFYDFTAVSRWVKGTPAENGKSLQKELDCGRRFNELLDKAWNGRKTRVEGNHDKRLANYLQQSAHGLAGLAVLDFDTLTDASEFGWETMPQPYKIAPGTVAVHGESVRKLSGYTAHAHLDQFNSNVVHGHTHRAGIVYRTIGDHTRWAMECGHLMAVGKADYTLSPDWQMGFALLHVDDASVAPQFIRIKNDGTFHWGGRKWLP